MKPIENQAHHDGHGLNDLHEIWADARDPKAGNASHEYEVVCDVSGTLYAIESGCTGQAQDVRAKVSFQHGARNEPRSTPGVTDAALLAIILDRYAGFQAGPYRCRENAMVITKLEEALHWMGHRANERARRGVLGKNEV